MFPGGPQPRTREAWEQLQQLPGNGDRRRPGQDVGVRFRLGAGNQDQPQSQNGWAGPWGWSCAGQSRGCAELSSDSHGSPGAGTPVGALAHGWAEERPQGRLGRDRESPC